MTSWWRNAALGPIPSTEMISNPGKPRKTKNSRSLFSPKDAHYECRLSGHIMNDDYPKSKKRKQLIPCFESLFSFCFVCLLCCFFFPGVRHSWALTNFSSRSQEVTRDEETNLTASNSGSSHRGGKVFSSYWPQAWQHLPHFVSSWKILDRREQLEACRQKF